LSEYIQESAKEKNMQAITIRVEKKILQYLNEQKYYNGFVSEKEVDGKMEMTFLTSFIEGFVRWIMMYGDMAEIVSPCELKERLRNLAGMIHDRNKT
jgi:predicted DNA-binding transcriptional regulator YafY